MDEEAERQSTHRALAAARTIRSLWDGAPDHVLAAPWNEILPPNPDDAKGGKAIDKVVVIRGLTTCRSACWMNDHRGNVYMIYTGTDARTARNLIYGWASQAAMLRAGGFNVGSRTDTQLPYTLPVQFLLVGAHSLYIYGHSAGGAAAECLASSHELTSRFFAREVITFGAPNPALQGFIRENLTTTRVRWMNLSDPVPQLPFARLGIGGGVAIDLSSADYTPTLITQGSGGRILYADGTWSAAPYTTGAIDPSQLGVAAWVAGLDGSTGNPHSIDTYIRRLSLLATRLDDNVSSRIQSTSTPRPRLVVEFFPRTPPTTNPLPDPGTVTIQGKIATTPGGSSFPVSTGLSTSMANQSRIDPSLRLVRQRAGRNYIVRWDDVVLFTCPTASSARSIMTSWNRSLRLLGKTSNISTAGVYSYLQMIFAAGGSGQGITPPWNVT